MEVTDLDPATSHSGGHTGAGDSARVAEVDSPQVAGEAPRATTDITNEAPTAPTDGVEGSATAHPDGTRVPTAHQLADQDVEAGKHPESAPAASEGRPRTSEVPQDRDVAGSQSPRDGADVAESGSSAPAESGAHEHGGPGAGARIGEGAAPEVGSAGHSGDIHGDGGLGRGDMGAHHGEGAGAAGHPEGTVPGTEHMDPEARMEARREHVAERQAQAEADQFNQEHRPEVAKEVVVSADDPLMPKATKPFGRGVDLEPNTCYSVDGRGEYYTDGDGRVTHGRHTPRWSEAIGGS